MSDELSAVPRGTMLFLGGDYRSTDILAVEQAGVPWEKIEDRWVGWPVQPLSTPDGVRLEITPPAGVPPCDCDCGNAADCPCLCHGNRS